MTKRRVLLIYDPETLAEPVIYNLGQQFNLITNIRRADISEETGWVELELVGRNKDIDEGLTWVTSRGIRVDQISSEEA